MSDRKGDWIQTYSGKKFWPLDPRPEEVHIEDIAHALALSCRFNGQCNFFYSVAAHSVNVAEFIANTYHKQDQFYNEFALGFAEEEISYDDMVMWGLLHDAAEAYLPDVPRPVKGHMKEYVATEENIMSIIAEKFELPKLGECHTNYLKSVDYLMLMVEHNELGMAEKAPEPWICPKFLKNKWPSIKLLINDNWEQDEAEFLHFFETLGVTAMERNNSFMESGNGKGKA